MNNVRLISELGELSLGNAETINITLNRIVEDFTEIDNKFQDFTYEFSLPRTKANELVFNNAGALYNKRMFIPNININCSLFNNDVLLLQGVINLIGVNENEYKCKLNSNFKEFIDNIAKKKLNTLTFPVIQNWEYEKTVREHILANYKNSDETTHQYPLVYYSTPFCQYDYYAGKFDNQDTPLAMTADNAYQNYYYLFNSVGSNDNRTYIHQLPPAIYLVSIVKQIIKESGWNLGGQFFEDENIKKIIFLYAGEDDIYDQATQQVSGTTALNLQIGKFLPDLDQSDFIQSVINTFNLYLIIDPKTKTIGFETHDVLFNDNFDPYDITYKVFSESIDYKYIENNDPSITFNKAQNRNIFGDNYVMSSLTNNTDDQLWRKCSATNFNKTFNREGTTDTIKIEFSEPTVKRQLIWQDKNISGVTTNAGPQTVYIPIISKQTPTNNNSKKFNNATGDTYVMNNESTISYAGRGSLMYYYGMSDTDFDNAVNAPLSDYMYLNIYYGFLQRIPIGIASPWQLRSIDHSKIEQYISGITMNNVEDRRTAIASYIQGLWQMMAKKSGLDLDLETDYSLVFDDNNYFHKSLWTKFHQLKYDTFKKGILLDGKMKMSEIDWNEMQIQRPIKYNGNLYRLISINYNPIKGLAEIQLISKT